MESQRLTRFVRARRFTQAGQGLQCPALQAWFYEVDGRCEAAGVWTLEPDGKWRLYDAIPPRPEDLLDADTFD